MCGRTGVSKPTQAFGVALFQSTQLTSQQMAMPIVCFQPVSLHMKESYSVQKTVWLFTSTEEGRAVEATGSN